MLARHEWQHDGNWGLCTFRNIQAMPAQHILLHWENGLHLWWEPDDTTHCHNDAAKANEKWTFLSLSTSSQGPHMMDFSGQAVGSEPKTCLHTYIPFLNWLRRGPVVLLFCKCVPLRNHQHRTNKPPPCDALAIQSHLHGRAGCCQDSLTAQC